MRFLFIAQGCLPFHHRSLEERPLGGTETGLIRLSDRLAKAGHEVIVATSLPNPPLSEPLYIPLSSAGEVGKVDVLVAVRDWQSLYLPIERTCALFWTGDSYDQPQTLGLGDRRNTEKMDAMLAVSSWQGSRFHQLVNVPAEKIWPIGNGVNLDYFSGTEPRDRHRLIYSSTPYRGLDLLPAIYQLIRQAVPTASLHVFSGFQVYAGAGEYPREVLERFERTKQTLSQMPGCAVRGNVKLTADSRQSQPLAYP